MLLFNEKNEQLDVASLKKEILANLKNVKTPQKEEIEKELGAYYNNALAIDMKSYHPEITAVKAFSGQTEISFLGLGGILEKIRRFICKILTGSSTEGDIIDAILQAIASIIPGGIILKGIIEKIAKYIISMGVGAFCKI